MRKRGGISGYGADMDVPDKDGQLAFGLHNVSGPYQDRQHGRGVAFPGEVSPGVPDLLRMYRRQAGHGGRRSEPGVCEDPAHRHYGK